MPSETTPTLESIFAPKPAATGASAYKSSNPIDSTAKQSLDDIFSPSKMSASSPLHQDTETKNTLDSIFKGTAPGKAPENVGLKPGDTGFVAHGLGEGLKDFWGKYSKIQDEAVQGIADTWINSWTDAKKNLTDSEPGKMNSVEDVATKGSHLAYDAMSALLAPFGGIMKVMGLGKPMEDVANLGKSIGDSDTGAGKIAADTGALISNIKPIKAIADYFDAHPEVETAIFRDIPTILQGVTLGMGAKETLSEMGSPKDVFTNTVKDVKGMASSVKENIVTPIKEKFSDVTSGFKQKTTGAFKGKTMDEILSTPEDGLQKLSPSDRSAYFDAKKAKLTETHALEQEKIAQQSLETETKIKAESDAKIAEIQGKNQELVNQADRASIEEAQALKPKVIQSMAENSKTYRELVDAEISKHADTPVNASEIRQFIESKYADNPAQASQVIDRLNLKEPVPKAGELPTIQAGAEGSAIPETTVGKVYENIKALKQEIGIAAKKGSRSFTSDEKLTDDAISTLSDYLKSKGVDLSEANKFWSQYAPLRNKVIKSVQPFTPRGSESGTFETFTKDIQKSVKGIDEGNKDFMSATEKLLGTKIGNGKVRAALEKLDSNQKAEFAAKLEKEMKLTEEKMAKENAQKQSKSKLSEEQKALDEKKFEADRKAKTRENVWKAIKWTTGIAIGYEEFKRLTGI